MCVVRDFIEKKEPYNECISIFAGRTTETEEIWRLLYANVLVEKIAIFSPSKIIYSNNPKNLAKKMEYFYEYKDDCSKL